MLQPLYSFRCVYSDPSLVISLFSSCDSLLSFTFQRTFPSLLWLFLLPTSPPSSLSISLLRSSPFLSSSPSIIQLFHSPRRQTFACMLLLSFPPSPSLPTSSLSLSLSPSSPFLHHLSPFSFSLYPFHFIPPCPRPLFPLHSLVFILFFLLLLLSSFLLLLLPLSIFL